MIAIGKIIEKVLREKHIPVTKFAQKINTNRNNVYSIFQRETIDTGLLLKICEVLGHDFFQYYISEQTRADIANDRANLYLVNSEIQQLKKKAEALEAEINSLKSQLRDKEIIIELLQKDRNDSTEKLP